MAKKVFKIIGIVLGCIVIGVGIVYLMVAFYYKNRFMPNTVISEKRVNAMTVDEVNKILMDDNDEYLLKVSFAEGKTVELKGDDFDYRYDYSESLNKILASQNQYEWPYYAYYGAVYDTYGIALYDEGKVVSLLNGLEEYSDPFDNSKAAVEIKNLGNNFTLKDERKPELDYSKATDDVLECIKKSRTECDLTSDYEAPVATDAQQKVLDNWNTLEKIQNAKITLSDDGIEMIIDKYVFSKWIKVNSSGIPVFDKEGSVLIDDAAADDFVKIISETFGTDGMDRKWQKYKGGIAKLPCKWDGYIVDEEAEKQALIKSVLTGKTETREPQYSQEGSGHGNEEVGDTYVEVDLSGQKMYYFEKGNLKLESDIVSGCKRYHNDTPSMITRIYFMQEGRTLRGENYATFVYYWMAFYNHYGLHDATWRREFGNDIYLTDGSHGCVNLPKDVAAQLYSMVEVGTPVVLYE